MKKLFFVVAAVLSGSRLIAQVEDTTKRALDEVVITATKSNIKQSQTGKVITVIDRATLDRSYGKDLAQLLTEQAGLVINGASSNPGKDKSVFLRGAKNDYTVILLNGIPVTDPSGVTGAFDLRLIPIDQIERIEIVKGAQSTLYGSNAVAGVINIITRQGGKKAAQLSGNLSAGSYSSYKANLGLNGSAEGVDYMIGFIHNETDGISEARDTAAVKTFDKDGFNQNGVYLNVNGEVLKGLHVKPWFRYNFFKGGYDNGAFSDDASVYTSSILSAGTAVQYDFNKGSVVAQYGYDEVSRNYFSATFNSASLFEGKSKIAEVYASYNPAKHVRLLAGVDHRKQESTDSSARITSPYLSLFLYDLHNFNVELGGRYNNHSRYGDNFTYSFNPSYLINNKVKVFANVASAFRAPSLNELYGPFGGNKDLKPEKSTTYEAGAQASIDIVDVRAVYFNRNTKNVIIYGPSFSYLNLNKQEDHGFEIEPTIRATKSLQLKLYYSFVDGEVTTTTGGKDTTYFNLIRRPKHSFGLTANYQVTKHFFVSTNLYNYGKRTDSFFDLSTFTTKPVSLESYLLWNVYAEYSFLSNRLKLFADGKNLLDKNYYEVYGYSTQGITVTGGVRFQL
jgi:vitamin B12 transporter